MMEHLPPVPASERRLQALTGALAGFAWGAGAGFLASLLGSFAPEVLAVGGWFVACPGVITSRAHTDGSPPEFWCDLGDGRFTDVSDATMTSGTLSWVIGVGVAASVVWLLPHVAGRQGIRLKQVALVTAGASGVLGLVALSALGAGIGPWMMVFPLAGAAFVLPMSLDGDRQRVLRDVGVRVWARVEAVNDTGVMVNDQPVLAFDLIIELGDRPPFRAQARGVVAHSQLGHVGEADRVAVLVDPTNTRFLAIEQV